MKNIWSALVIPDRFLKPRTPVKFENALNQ